VVVFVGGSATTAANLAPFTSLASTRPILAKPKQQPADREGARNGASSSQASGPRKLDASHKRSLTRTKLGDLRRHLPEIPATWPINNQFARTLSLRSVGATQRAN